MKEETCFFCGKRPGTPASVFKQPMMEKRGAVEHKEVVNTPGGIDVKVTKTVTVYLDTPRCPECKSIHDKANKSTTLPLLLVAFSGSALAFVLFRGHGVVWWMIGFWIVFAVLADATIARAIVKNAVRSKGILSAYDTRTYPKVAEGLQKGQKWGIGR